MSQGVLPPRGTMPKALTPHGGSDNNICVRSAVGTVATTTLNSAATNNNIFTYNIVPMMHLEELEKRARVTPDKRWY